MYRCAVLLVGCAVLLVGCAERSAHAVSPLVFLTRDGCASTPAMRANLDKALRSLEQSADYTVIDTNTLPESDPRRG